MKKNLQKIACIFTIAMVAASCSDDNSAAAAAGIINQDPVVTTHIVEYKVTVSAPVLTKITYTNTDGNDVAATETLGGATTWNKAVTINSTPFNAKLKIEAEAQPGVTWQYSWQFLVDGVVKHSGNGSSIGTSETVEASYGFQ